MTTEGGFFGDVLSVGSGEDPLLIVYADDGHIVARIACDGSTWFDWNGIAELADSFQAQQQNMGVVLANMLIAARLSVCSEVYQFVHN